MKNCEHVLRNVNWKLLREQKAYCANEAANNENTYRIYNGVLNLLDHLQDAAILDGIATEEEVFGNENADFDRGEEEERIGDD